MTDQFGRREEWLHRAADMVLAQYRAVFILHFGDEGRKHLERIRASAGFPSRRGENGKVIGQCWKSSTTKDGSHHIFINPLLENPVEVVATLAHEMVHAADDGEHAHKGVFVKCVRDLGLAGKPTATVAGEKFEAWVKTVLLPELGDYPHVALKPTLKPKVQKTYMLKVECPKCHAVARLTEKWIDESGVPFCGKCTEYPVYEDGEVEYDHYYPVRMVQV